MPRQGLRLQGLDLSKPTDLHNPRTAARGELTKEQRDQYEKEMQEYWKQHDKEHPVAGYARKAFETLGGKNPLGDLYNPSEDLTEEQKKQYEATMQEYWRQHDKEHPVLGFARGALEGLGGASSLDDPTRKADSSDYGKGAADVLQSGLPFGAFIKGLRGGKLYHGTPKIDRLVQEGFKPEFHNKADTLGWMTHFAEDPKYAERYSTKGGRYGEAPRQGMTAVTLDAENVLDLYHPMDEDIEAMKKGINSSNYGKLFRGQTPSLAHGVNPKLQSPETLTDFVHRMTPSEFNKMGFDAVRYPDVGLTTGAHEPSWAVPDPKKIRNAYTGEIMHGLGGETEEQFRKRIADAHGIDWANSLNWNITPTPPKKVIKGNPKKFYMSTGKPQYTDPKELDEIFKNFPNAEYDPKTSLWKANTDPPTYHMSPDVAEFHSNYKTKEAAKEASEKADWESYLALPEAYPDNPRSGDPLKPTKYTTDELAKIEKFSKDNPPGSSFWSAKPEDVPEKEIKGLAGMKSGDQLAPPSYAGNIMPPSGPKTTQADWDKWQEEVNKWKAEKKPPIKPYELSETEKAAQKEHDDWMSNWEKDHPAPKQLEAPVSVNDIPMPDEPGKITHIYEDWNSKGFYKKPPAPDPFYKTKEAVDDYWDKFWKQHSLSDPAKKKK